MAATSEKIQKIAAGASAMNDEYRVARVVFELGHYNEALDDAGYNAQMISKGMAERTVGAEEKAMLTPLFGKTAETELSNEWAALGRVQIEIDAFCAAAKAGSSVTCQKAQKLNQERASLSAKLWDEFQFIAERL